MSYSWRADTELWQKMWWKAKRSVEAVRRFAVLVHARKLLLAGDASRECIGGAYAWRYVTAANESAAARAAIDAVFATELFIDEVRNLEEAMVHGKAEEIFPFRRGQETRDSAIVFYIETSEDDGCSMGGDV